MCQPGLKIVLHALTKLMTNTIIHLDGHQLSNKLLQLFNNMCRSIQWNHFIVLARENEDRFLEHSSDLLTVFSLRIICQTTTKDTAEVHATNDAHKVFRKVRVRGLQTELCQPDFHQVVEIGTADNAASPVDFPLYKSDFVKDEARHRLEQGPSRQHAPPD